MPEHTWKPHIPDAVQKKYDEEDSKTTKCPICGGEFFIEFFTRRYIDVSGNIDPADALISGVPYSPPALGQGLTPIDDKSFPVYMCVTRNCHNIIVPPVSDVVQHGRTYDLFNRLYDIVEKGREGA